MRWGLCDQNCCVAAHFGEKAWLSKDAFESEPEDQAEVAPHNIRPKDHGDSADKKITQGWPFSPVSPSLLLHYAFVRTSCLDWMDMANVPFVQTEKEALQTLRKHVQNMRPWQISLFFAAEASISKKRVQSRPAESKSKPKKPRVQPAMSHLTEEKGQALEAEKAATEADSQNNVMDQDMAILGKRIVSPIKKSKLPMQTIHVTNYEYRSTRM